MAEPIHSTAAMSQTKPVERLRDSKREAIDQDGKRRRPRKSADPVPEEREAVETDQTDGLNEENKQSGKILDILV